MKSWKIKYSINSYLSFKDEFEVDKINFFYSDNINYALAKIEAETIAEAERNCNEKLVETIKGMEFIYEQKFSSSLLEIQEETAGVYTKVALSNLPSSLGVRQTLSITHLSSLNVMLKSISTADETARNAYECYLRGFEVYEWNSEAFLNFYKVIELIAGQYLKLKITEKREITETNFIELSKELKKLLNEIEIDRDRIIKLCCEVRNLDLVSMREKFLLALHRLELEEYATQATELTKLRNKVAAHGTDNQIISNEELFMCKELSRKMIINYINRIQ